MFRIILLAILFIFSTSSLFALNEKELTSFIKAPDKLGKKDTKLPVWEILNKNDELKGYVYESYELAPVLGFSGGKMNMLVTIDLKGEFQEVLVLEQDEPVFVSGLGVVPFVEFLNQYKGNFLSDSIKVGKETSGGTNTVHLDGVSKATASVKIANDSILAASIKVAREKLSGVAPKIKASIDKSKYEKLTWKELLSKGLVKHIKIKNSEVEALFKGSDFEDEELKSTPDELFLDLWVTNVSIPSVAKNIISQETQDELNGQLEPTQEGILVLANGPHQILAEDFVRNTSPDTLEIKQDNFPVAIHDGDYEITFIEGIPEFEQSLILQVDNRFNFDSASIWDFNVKVIRGATSLYSESLNKDLNLKVELPKEYFIFPKKEEKTPLWLSSIYEQKIKLSILTLALIGLFIALFKYQVLLSKLRYKRTFLLLITLFFIGWYGQGQLSIVTVLGFIKSIVNSESLQFLLYDPFSLIIWFFVLLSLLIWGRGTFCGWLCPYGVLQELTYYFARIIKLPKIKVKDKLNSKLSYIKYIILFTLIICAIYYPNINEYLKEVEPFKTSITLMFDREIPYVLYALFWLIASMFVFKAFCRYFCPLGAFLSLLGRIKYLDWLPRRKECGNPCNNCYKNCNYNAIDKKSGVIKYADCFQCMDCVQIYSDDKLCKILIKDSNKEKEITVKKWSKDYE